MFSEYAERVFLFAIHPKGLHNLIRSSLSSRNSLDLRRCKQLSSDELHFLNMNGWCFYPFVVENEDQDFGEHVTDATNAVTRFCCVFDTPYMNAPRIPDSLKCKLIFQTLKNLRSTGFVNSVEIAVWEDKPPNDLITLNDNLNGAINLFLRSVSFISEVSKAASLFAGIKNIFDKSTLYDLEELFISVQVEVLLHNPALYSCSFEKEKYKQKITSQLREDVRTNGKKWKIDSMENPKNYDIFKLNVLFDHNRITAGIEIAGPATMHPFLINRSVDPALASFVVHVADIKKGSIIADLNCGQGELLCSALRKADCMCFGFEVNTVKMALAEQNRVHLFKYLSKYRTSRCPVRELSLLLMTPFSNSFRFSHVTHILCHVPSSLVRNATADELVTYYERIFDIISRAYIAVTVLIVPRIHRRTVMLSTQAVAGKLEYPFDVVAAYDIHAKTEEVTVMRLQLNTRKLQTIHSAKVG